MGRLILISGPNGSGKSAYAERLIARTPGERYYIATMVPRTAENFARIEEHRRRREGLGFHTMEIPGNLRSVGVPKSAAVLLEDVSNLLANGMFDAGRTADEVFADILALAERCGTLAAVTISGLSPEGYGGETAGYIAALNDLNARLLARADAAAELRASIPYILKGSIE